MGMTKIFEEMDQGAREALKESTEKIMNKIDPDDYRGELIHPEDKDEVSEEKKKPLVVAGTGKNTSLKKAQLAVQYATTLFDQEISRPFSKEPRMSSGGKIGRKKKAGKTFGKNKKKKK